MQNGHVEGNLNFVANRRGWSRNFTLPPSEAQAMTYDTLAALLELKTINLRGRRLRLFVEHPAASGHFAPVQKWADDGCLQSELVKAFFVERLRTGVVTVLDIRDVAEDELPPLTDAAAEKAHGAAVARRGTARDWIRSHARGSKSTQVTDSMAYSGSSEELVMAGPSNPTANPNSSILSFLSRNSMIGASVPAPPPAPAPAKHARQPSDPTVLTMQPSPPHSDAETDARREDDMLQSRGWTPRVIRRLTAAAANSMRRHPKQRASMPAAGAGAQWAVDADGDLELVPGGGGRPAPLSLKRTKSSALLRRRPRAHDAFRRMNASMVEIIRSPADALMAPAPAVVFHPGTDVARWRAEAEAAAGVPVVENVGAVH